MLASRSDSKGSGIAMISIVVCSYDFERRDDLRNLIDSFRLQLNSTELIIVIEKSSELDDLIKEYAHRIPNIKVLFVLERLGLANARNLGIDNAIGDIIAFVDDDADLTLSWATSIEIFMKAYPEAVGVTGRILPNWEDQRDRDMWFPESLYWTIGCDASIEKGQSLGHGTNMAFRKEAIEGIRFIDEFSDGGKTKTGLVGDDVDFQLRVLRMNEGKKILYDPSITVFHKVPHRKTSIGYVAKYSFWQGASEARFNKLFGARSRGKERQKVIGGLVRSYGARSQIALMCGALGFIAYSLKVVK